MDSRMRKDLGPQMIQGLVDLCEYMLNELGYSLLMDKAGTAYEIGSFAGESAEVFARYFAVVHCVDPWTFEDMARISLSYRVGIEASFDERAARAGNIVKHKAPSLEVAPTVVDASLDFVYIDGDHGYDGAFGDFHAWWPKVRSGGFLGGHDYSYADVGKAISDFFKRSPDRTFNDLADLSNPEFQVGSWVYRKS